MTRGQAFNILFNGRQERTPSIALASGVSYLLRDRAGVTIVYYTPKAVQGFDRARTRSRLLWADSRTVFLLGRKILIAA